MALTCISFVTFSVSMGSSSGITVYIDKLGGSAAYAGMLAGVFSFSAAFARILSSAWLDTRGRFKVLVLGIVMLFIGTLGPSIVAEGFVFAIWRACQGIGFSAVTTAAATAAADIVPYARLGEGIGYYGLGQALGFAVGPACAMILVAMDPPEWLFYGFTIANLLVFVFVLFCRYEKDPLKLPISAGYRVRWEKEHRQMQNPSVEIAPTPEPQQEKDDGQQREFRGIYRVYEPKALVGAIPLMAVTPIFGFVTYFGTMYGIELGIGNPGLLFTASAVAMVIVRASSKAFMDTVAAIKIHVAATAAAGFIAIFFLAAAQQPADSLARFVLYLAAGACYGIGAGVATPNNQSVAVRNTPSNRWGAANALVLLAMDVGIGVGSIVWGIINDAYGYHVTLICLVFCAVVSIVLAFIFYPENAKRSKKKDA